MTTVSYGLTPWEKLFTNLRASRATELAAEYPSHIAAAWLEHSEIIANKHYRQITDADFERAAKSSAAKSGATVAQTAAESSGSDAKPAGTENEKDPEFPSLSPSCPPVYKCRVGGEGLESLPDSSGKAGLAVKSGADCGARFDDSAAAQAERTAAYPDLAAVVKAWPTLSADVRAAVLAMIPAANGATGRGAGE